MPDRPTAAALFAARLRAGLGREPELAERLAFADTTICLTAGDGSAVTMLLSPECVEVLLGDTPAEIRAELSSESLARFADGELLLPLALAAGEGRHHGPVRRLLAVSPILRTLVAAGAAVEAAG